MATQSKTTTDHDIIRRWAEKRGAVPSTVSRTRSARDVGIIRLDFPGFSGEGTLEPISWDEFFAKFDEGGLAFTFQEKTAAGKTSNFNRFVKRSTAAARARGAEKKGAAGNGSKRAASGSKRAASGSKRAASGSKRAASGSKRGATTKAAATTTKRPASGSKRPASAGKRTASAGSKGQGESASKRPARPATKRTARSTSPRTGQRAPKRGGKSASAR